MSKNAMVRVLVSPFFRLRAYQTQSCESGGLVSEKSMTRKGLTEPNKVFRCGRQTKCIHTEFEASSTRGSQI